MQATPGPGQHRIRTFGLWGNFGTLNLGNECTLAAAIVNLRRLAPGVELLGVCREPEDTTRRHGIEAVRIHAPFAGDSVPAPPGWLRKPRRALRELGEWVRAFKVARRLDALLITGTGVLTDGGEGTFGLPYELFKWSLLTRLTGGKVLFLSVGVEPTSASLSKLFINNALRLADYRSYRDEHSRRLIQSLGFSAGKDNVYPDLAFSLPPVPEPHRAPPPGARGRVAVGLFNYRLRGEGGGDSRAAYDAYLDWICSLIIWLLEHDFEVRVIIGDFTYDEPVRIDVRRALQARGVDLLQPGYRDEPALSFEQVMLQIDSVDLVLASRFHNVLLSLFMGIPVVSVSYDPKNDALMNMMGLGEYCQSLDHVDYPQLLQQFQQMERNAAQLRGALLARGRECRVLLEEQYAKILRVTGLS